MRRDATTPAEQARRRVIVRRGFLIEPWRISTHLRIFRGNGLANFEFEFRFGFPRRSRSAIREVITELAEKVRSDV